MRYLTNIPREDLKGKRVLLRTDLNVPIDNGKVVNDFRIRRSLNTIKYLSKHGAKTVVISHIGRKSDETLEPVAKILDKNLSNFAFVSDTLDKVVQEVAGDKMKKGDVVLLENLRRYEGETQNNNEFAKALSLLGEIFVGDAFAVSHREHASIVGIPKFLPSYGGLLMQDEIEHLSMALKPPQMAFAVLGGAKFETKEPLIEKLSAVYDNVFIGGALANDIFLAKGFEVGRSLISDKRPSDEILFHKKVIAPVDVVVEKLDGNSRTCLPNQVKVDEKIVDIGPESIKEIIPLIKNAKFILWNGPMGLYEGGFDKWTRELAKEISKSDAHTIVGGGDTLATIQDEDLEDDFSFISTGGGAMLEYLLNGTLVGIEVLENNHKQ
jgi:phosphoglycerate kinase